MIINGALAVARITNKWATGGCIWWSNIEPFQRSPTGIWDAILAFSTGHVIILWKLVWNRKWAIFAIIVDRAGHEIWKMSHFDRCAKNGKWAIFAIFVDQSGHEIWQISHFDPWWLPSESSSESSDRFLKSGLLGILATARDNTNKRMAGVLTGSLYWFFYWRNMLKKDL